MDSLHSEALWSGCSLLSCRPKRLSGIRFGRWDRCPVGYQPFACQCRPSRWNWRWHAASSRYRLACRLRDPRIPSDILDQIAVVVSFGLSDGIEIHLVLPDTFLDQLAGEWDHSVRIGNFESVDPRGLRSDLPTPQIPKTVSFESEFYATFSAQTVLEALVINHRRQGRHSISSTDRIQSLERRKCKLYRFPIDVDSSCE